MLQMLQEFQFSVCPLRQDRRAEGFHDLLHRYRLSGELVLGRAVHNLQLLLWTDLSLNDSPDKPEGAHTDRL